jgi:hypothetical protein
MGGAWTAHGEMRNEYKIFILEGLNGRDRSKDRGVEE